MVLEYSSKREERGQRVFPARQNTSMFHPDSLTDRNLELAFSPKKQVLEIAAYRKEIGFYRQSY